MDEGALLLAVLQPAFVGAMLAIWPGVRANVCRWAALGSTSLSLMLVLWLVTRFDPDRAAATQFLIGWPWVPETPLQFALGLDGLSLWLVVLSAFLCWVAVLSAWESIVTGARAFYALLLILTSGLLGVFAAVDVVLFYIFFEFTLLPLFFIIGVWGGPDRRAAAVKFFIYTLAGSLLSFLGLLYVLMAHYNHFGRWTFAIPELRDVFQAKPLGLLEQRFVFLALFAGFAVKVPLFPFHTWLPLAHVEAPTPGSVLLAGVLLKLGAYGFARFSLPLVPQACTEFFPLVAALAVIGVVYGALCALAQSDLKRLVAYSSISHMGLCVLGLFAQNEPGVAGGVLQMVHHGLATGALFAIVGMLYERHHTRMMEDMGGLARLLPRLTILTIWIVLASLGLPGLGGFVSEILILLGAFMVHRGWAAFAALSLVLSAYYLLRMVQRVFFGKLRLPHSAASSCPDLKPHEGALLIPVALASLWIGLYPRFFLDRLNPAVASVLGLPAATAEVAPRPRWLETTSQPTSIRGS